MRIEQELQKMGFILPTPKPLAAYIPAVKVGNLVWTAGQGPSVDGKAMFTGKLGREVTEEQGYKAAQICIVNCLACVKSLIADLDKIERVVKTLGFRGFGRRIRPAALGHERRIGASREALR